MMGGKTLDQFRSRQQARRMKETEGSTKTQDSNKENMKNNDK